MPLPFNSLNDFDFLSFLNDGSQSLSLDIINKLNYFPVCSNDSNIIDDSLSRVIFQEPVCDYYFCNKEVLTFPSGCTNFNILSFNISSVSMHLDSLVHQCLTPLNAKFDVICLCETRLNDNIASLYNMWLRCLLSKQKHMWWWIGNLRE